MGPVCRAMLTALETSPDGRKGLRAHEVSKAAIGNAWATFEGAISNRVSYYAITDAGRRVLAAWRDHNPGRT